MILGFFNTTGILDFIWPSLEFVETKHQLSTEIKKIKSDAANLPSTKEYLKEHVASSEKLLDAEHSRKSGIESRLLNIAGLVSIAGSVVLGTLFSFLTEKALLLSPFVKGLLSIECLYLAVQLVAALCASIRGLKARGYDEDSPFELIPRKGIKRKVFLRERIIQILVRVAKHRWCNDKKLSHLNVAHYAMRNFLFGLLVVAVSVCFVSLFSPLSPLPISPCVEWVECQKNISDVRDISALGRRTALIPTEDWSAIDIKPPIALISAGIVIAVSGLILIFFGTTTVRRVAGVMMTVGGIGLSIVGNGKLTTTLFKIDNLIGELQLNLNLERKNQKQQVFFRRVLTVGPFPDGSHLLAKDQVNQCVKTALDKYKGFTIGGWEIIGRVDKRALKNELIPVYGSNQGLAMSRASWVGQNILATFPSFDPGHVVISVGGAREIGKSLSLSDLEHDRAVDVFAVINANVVDKEVPVLPNPIVCPTPKSSS